MAHCDINFEAGGVAPVSDVGRLDGLADGLEATGEHVIRVLVADDHRLLVDAMYRPLRHFGFDVSVSNSFEEAMELLRTEIYDVILLDVDMPGMDGLQSVQSVVRANETGAVVLFSGVASPRFVKQAMDSGVKGFIPKSVSLMALENAIRLVASGEPFVPYGFFDNLSASSIDRPDRKGSKLSSLEIEILDLVASGLSNKEIAYRLDLSEVNVKMHMRSICSKLDAKNRTEAAMIGKQHHII